MTRRSKRAIERTLNDLDITDDAGDDPGVLVAHRDSRTDDLSDVDSDPLPPGANPEYIIQDVTVTSRERAEEQGQHILGPAPERGRRPPGPGRRRAHRFDAEKF